MLSLPATGSVTLAPGLHIIKEESEKTVLKLNIQKTKIMASSPIISWQRVGEKNGNSGRFYFLGLQNHCRRWCLLLARKAMTSLDSVLKSKDTTLPTKVCIVEAMVVPSSHVWIWELDHKEGWAPNNWCFSTVVPEKTLESSLDCKEIKPVNSKGN